MKKFLALFLMIFFALPVAAHAEESTMIAENELYFKTYQQESVSLMSVTVTDYDELEQMLIDAWTNLETEVIVRDFRLSIDEFDEFYKKVLFAHPLFFYVLSGYSYSLEWYSEEDAWVAYIHIHYNSTYIETDEYDVILPGADIDAAKEKILKKTNEIEAATDEILFYINGNMTEFEKVMTVHDYMVRKYSYDWDYYNRVCEDENEIDPSYFGYSLEIMTEKTGVCQGYTLAFSHIMQQLGIDTAFVSSVSMQHAWNLVKVDGQWYHIDVTWDDLDCCDTHAHHDYGLLSTDHILTMDNPHYGFDTGDIVADSDKYDDAAWHSDVTPLAFCHGMEYWIDGDNLVRSDGEIIYENLSGSNNWRIDSSDVEPGKSYAINGTYAGVVAYNHKIYFNTDTEILCYAEDGTITSVTKKTGDIPGISGLRVENNELVYEILYLTEDYKAGIKEGGRIVLENVRIMDPYIENGKLIAKMYRKDTTPMTIYMSGNDKVLSKTINESGYMTVEFDAAGDQTLFFWDKDLKPLREKEVVHAR